MVEERFCWKCGLNAHMTRAVDPWLADRHKIGGHYRPMVAVFKCDNCAWPSIGVGANYPKAPNNDQLRKDQANYLQRAKSWHPQAAIGKDFPDVPKHIASTADEAHRCRSFDALRGSVILARAVIEATAKDKGITEYGIKAKIDKLHSKGLIREHIKQAADAVKDVGNEMAHGDVGSVITEQDADDVLALMKVVLDEVYQVQAITDSLIARRQKAKNP